MDNLDRTNVVQAAIAKYKLNQQLRVLGILSETDGVDDFEAFSKDFRESKSRIYTGLISSLTTLCSVGQSRRQYCKGIRRFWSFEV